MSFSHRKCIVGLIITMCWRVVSSLMWQSNTAENTMDLLALLVVILLKELMGSSKGSGHTK